jgi:hypothetical protein
MTGTVNRAEMTAGMTGEITDSGDTVQAVGTYLLRYGLVFVIASTPGWEASLGGFPALSAVPGQFILKDLVLLGAAVWSLGEALPHVRS